MRAHGVCEQSWIIANTHVCGFKGLKKRFLPLIMEKKHGNKKQGAIRILILIYADRREKGAKLKEENYAGNYWSNG